MSISENSTLLAHTREGDSASQFMDDRIQGPSVNPYEKSPYTDTDFVSLDVGPDHAIFRVHRVVLSQSPELEVKPFSKLWGDKAVELIALPETDEATAHTLVHYLYSGLYQTLHSHAATPDGALSAYRLGTCVYVASVRYKLPGLADLSKEQINVSSEDLSILQILSVAREHAFPHLPADEQWYPKYLEAAIHAAFTKDPVFFTTGDFVDQLEGDRRFRQVVMRAVVGTLSLAPMVEESTPVKEDVEDAIPPPVEINSNVDDKAIDQTDGLKGDTQDASEDPAAEPKMPVEAEEKDLDLDAIEPTPAPPKLESFTDEVGFGTSQTFLKLRRTDSLVGVANKSDEKPQHLSHERVNSVSEDLGKDSVEAPEVDGEIGGDIAVGVEMVAAEPTIEAVEDEQTIQTPADEPPTEAIAEEPTNETATIEAPIATSSKKKKKGKKNEAAAIEAPPTPMSKKQRKKMKNDAAVAAASPPSLPATSPFASNTT